MMAAILLAAQTAAAGTGAGLCALCHPDVQVQFERSIHGTESVTCTSCHGGDAKASTVAAAHAGGFRGKIRRRDIPALCASCHSDAARMSPYNLPTDQYALYQTSSHGRGLAKGDEKVAVCTDCHGVHEILPREDARSSVFAANIPATCARCHSGAPYADFSAGRHGQALLERRDTSAPGCSRCHGAHGATPPGVGDVNKVCGQCHVTARAYFLQGPHHLAMDKAGLPECASCHGHHKVERASVETMQTVCAKCHDAGSQPVALAIRMKTLYAAAAADLESARRLVNEAKAIPLYVADFEARLEEGHTALVESLPAMHAVELPAVEQLTSRAQSIGHEVESEVRSKLEGRRWRGVGLLLFWFYLIVTLATLLHFRRRAARAGP